LIRGKAECTKPALQEYLRIGHIKHETAALVLWNNAAFRGINVTGFLEAPLLGEFFV
jgi:hypothetical protein